jgi:hypothetical protein
MHLRFPQRGVVWGVILSLGLLAGAEEHVSAIEPGEQRVEITIQDATFLKTKTMPIRAELPLVIVIHNDDNIRHGFTSPMLKGLAVEGEGEGIDFYGRGIDGVHIGPGKTVSLRLIVPHQGSLPFHCDLHSDMQGEVYLLDVPVA